MCRSVFFSLYGVCPKSYSESIFPHAIEQGYWIVLRLFENHVTRFIQATFFRQLFSALLLFEHNCWHFQLRKVWHPEVLSFSATGNLQFYFIDFFGDNLWLAHQILVSGLFFRRLPPFTLWMDFPEAIIQIYPVVPRAFHSLWVIWRTSDIKTRNFIFLL